MIENTFWWRLTHLEPAIYKGIIVGLVGLLAAFGVVISPELPDQLLFFITAAMTLVQALWTKASVTPNAKVLAYLADPAKPKVITSGEAMTTATDAAIITAVREQG